MLGCTLVGSHNKLAFSPLLGLASPRLALVLDAASRSSGVRLPPQQPLSEPPPNSRCPVARKRAASAHDRAPTWRNKHEPEPESEPARIQIKLEAAHLQPDAPRHLKIMVIYTRTSRRPYLVAILAAADCFGQEQAAR